MPLENKSQQQFHEEVRALTGNLWKMLNLQPTSGKNEARRLRIANGLLKKKYSHSDPEVTIPIGCPVGYNLARQLAKTGFLVGPNTEEENQVIHVTRETLGSTWESALDYVVTCNVYVQYRLYDEKMKKKENRGNTQS